MATESEEILAFTVRIPKLSRRKLNVKAAENDMKPNELITLLADHLADMPIEDWIAQSADS